MFCAKLLLDDIMLLLNTGHPFAKLLNMKGPGFSRNILSFCLIWIDADLHQIVVGGLRVLSGVLFCRNYSEDKDSHGVIALVL